MDGNFIFSSYSLNSPYWMIFEGAPLEAMIKARAESLYHQPNLMGLKVSAQWVKQWKQIVENFPSLGDNMLIRAAVIPADTLPSLQEIELSLKPIAEIEAVAQHIWLARYLSEGRLVCFLQQVVDRSGNYTGYEAFARIDAPDGTLINGGAIMQASRALRLEYQVDRLMHQHAVQSFVQQNLEGLLFINFLTGFIHLPEVYLEGLSQAVERYYVPPQTIVLDVPLGSYGSDIPKLKTIAHYCRHRGFSMALDDVSSADGLAPLLEEIRPAYVKLAPSVGSTVGTVEGQQKIKEIILRARAFGAQVIAEAVETEKQHQAYLDTDVDLFQGYFFGAPMRYPPKASIAASSA